MFPIIEDPKRQNKIQDYTDYLDKSRRTNGKSRYEVHQIALSRETARSYGLSEKEIVVLDAVYKKEEESNEN